ncbi:MAG: hypothetical protein U0936_22485 [Planctomycetaceae bacterium]
MSLVLQPNWRAETALVMMAISFRVYSRVSSARTVLANLLRQPLQQTLYQRDRSMSNTMISG